jgi:predicted oxidoreductase
VTKCGIKLVSQHRPEHTIKYYDTSRDHIVASVENSLQMLRTDYIDILLIHRPDPLMDADEVAEAFTALRTSGKVLHFGVSNFLPGQFELLASRIAFPLVTDQVEISVLNLEHFEDGTIDFCQKEGIVPMAWSPLGGGCLFSGEDGRARRVRTVLHEIGDSFGGASIDQVALAWLLHHPSRIIPVLGTGRIDRVRQSIQAESLSLSREQWFKIWSASTGSEVP